ncbi:hypothetical protein [Acinetobacter sp. AG3]|uniref:hypothetical protein n=1 Tax=unclassified Acinetobacter TaxID=196816 RepID=UPI001EEFB892|nr:hypothetical protein [Acinetobacter sp. AG3]MCG7221237.1 hypothetical protein [Acinetobacter sp. AG3]
MKSFKLLLGISEVDKIFDGLDNKDKIELFDHIVDKYQDALIESEVMCESFKNYSVAHLNRHNPDICPTCKRKL